MVDTKRLALTFGLTGAVLVFVLGLSGWLLSFGVEWIEFLATVYRGYAPTLVGSFVGALWGFADGFIAGALFGWIFNRLQS